MSILRSKVLQYTGWFIFFLIILGGSNKLANGRSQQEIQEGLTIIENFSSKLCQDIPIEGYGEKVELTGSAKAELNRLLRKLADLKIEGAGKYEKSKYQGILRKDLAVILESSIDCKREIFRSLVGIVFPNEPDISSSNQPDTLFSEGEYNNKISKPSIKIDWNNVNKFFTVKNISIQNSYNNYTLRVLVTAKNNLSGYFNVIAFDNNNVKLCPFDSYCDSYMEYNHGIVFLDDALTGSFSKGEGHWGTTLLSGNAARLEINFSQSRW